MATVESPAAVNILVVSDTPEPSELSFGGLDKLGWRPWHLAPADLWRSDVTSRPPDAALISILGSLTELVNAVQALVAAVPGVPVVVLSDDLAAAEQALFGGATAVLPASARTSLVHAQLRAVQRQAVESRQSSEQSGIFRVRAIKLDTLRCEVIANGHRLDLTPTEFRILAALVRHAGRALGADFLIQQNEAAEAKPGGAREIVKVHMTRLRRKLLDATGEDDYILNVRNIGYLLDRRRRGLRKE